MSEMSKAARAKIIKAYNQVVKGFKQTWGVLRAISLILPRNTDELANAKTHIRELQKKVTSVERAIRAGKLDKAPEKLKRLGLELRVFRELMERIVAGVDAAAIRKFFQKTHDTRDDEIIELIRFFSAKRVLAEDDIDKVDLLVTEACTTRVGYKRVLKPDFEVSEIIQHIFEEEVPANEYEEQVLKEFNVAMKRIEDARNIDEIIRNEMIATMRGFKKEVAHIFINPRIFEASLRYNVVLNNKLAAILEKEEGEIQKASELEGRLEGLNPGQLETAQGLVQKVRHMQEAYARRRAGKTYDLKLIIEAAMQRKAIQESINKLGEIESADRKLEEEGFSRKTIQAYMNDIFHGLLKLHSNDEESVKIRGLNLELGKMDPWEKSLFLMDTQTLGEDQRMFEALKEAIVMRSKIMEEYKAAKRELKRGDVEAIIVENMEVANHLSEELQGFMDTYDRRARTFSVIDLMKVKSSLARSINRLKSLARMEGYSTKTK